MIHTRDTSPRSFSSSTPVATLRASPAGLLGLVLALVVGAGRADNRCHVSVINQYNVALAMYSYDGGDGICAIPYGAYEVNGNGSTLDRPACYARPPGWVRHGCTTFTRSVGPTASHTYFTRDHKFDLSFLPLR